MSVRTMLVDVRVLDLHGHVGAVVQRNTQLREVLDDATDKWGVRVVRVEIQRIDPPPEVVSAMHAQMRAERDRRATVTEAQGYREAAIARADGEKQSSILAAEGRKEASILDAQGDAQAIELRADAERIRLERFGQGEGEAAKQRLLGIKSADADQTVLTVEYLTALTRIGDGRATKLVIPTEFSGCWACSPPSPRPPVRRQPGRGPPEERPAGAAGTGADRASGAGLMKASEAPPPGWYPIPKAACACGGGKAPTGATGTGLDRASMSGCWDRTRRDPSCPATRRRCCATSLPQGAGQYSQARSGENAELSPRSVRRHGPRSTALPMCSAPGARAATGKIEPMITEYTSRVLRWIKIALAIAFVLLIVWVVFSAIAQMTFFEWLGDRIDNLTDESSGLMGS